VAVSSSTSKAGPYNGDGVTTVFAFSIQSQQGADVKVISTATVGGVLTDTTLTQGADYTVALNADQSASPGGSITATVAPATGVQITILRNVGATQGASIPNQGGFYPKVLENALDKLTMLVQQALEETGRALKVSVADAITSVSDLLTTINNTIAAGQASVNVSVAAAAASAATAVNAPSTKATSATSFTLALGSKTFALDQAGKSFGVGQPVSIARTSDASKICYGTVTAFADPSLTVNVTQADIAGGPYTDWTIALSGPRGASGSANGGALTTDPMSANLVLTSASKRYQVIAPNAGGFAVVLADATTLTDAGGPQTIIRNVGSYPAAIKNSSSGNVVGWSMPNSIAMVFCASQATADGVWSVSCGEFPGAADGIYIGGGQPLTHETHDYTQAWNAVAVQLDSTYGILFREVHNGAPNNSIFATGYKIAAGGLKFGADESVGSAASAAAPFRLDAVAVTATWAFVAYSVPGSGTSLCQVYEINTSTLALTAKGVAQTIEAAELVYASCTLLSATLALVAYGITTAHKAVTVSINGSTGACTVNAVATVQTADANGPGAVVALSATLAHAVYYNNTTSRPMVVRLTVSGTTITVGTPTVLKSAAYRPSGVWKGSATTSIVLYVLDSTTPSTLSTTYGVVVTDTGSGITLGTETRLPDTADLTSRGQMRGAQLADGRVLLCLSFGNDASPVTYGLANLTVSGGVPVVSRINDFKGGTAMIALGAVKPSGCIGVLAYSSSATRISATPAAAQRACILGGSAL